MTISSVSNYLKTRFGEAIKIGSECDLPPDLCVEIDERALLVLGDRVSIRRGTTIQVHCGATVIIGNDVAIGENTFISAMVGIQIGDGVGISNMVDLHDHNHRDRTGILSKGPPTPWESGFIGAPIIIENGAVISNKVSITAGVRVGQNTIIGANSSVIRSIGPNTMAVGCPAAPKRTFDASLHELPRMKIVVDWFGTSIMQHFEGFNAQMANQAALPAVGSNVMVEGWCNRGYVNRLHTTLQTRWPFLDIAFRNYGAGGATSRDILKTVHNHFGKNLASASISMLGCGINDVWRGLQGRNAEAVDLSEFTANYEKILSVLTANSRQVICIGETPFGWDDSIDIIAGNEILEGYNIAAEKVAAAAGAAFINVWTAFKTTSRQFGAGSGLNLWSDGVHLSEHGDALLHDLVDAHLREHDIIAQMTTYEIQDRDTAVELYRPLFIAADLKLTVGGAT